jgi:hypothetical protein
MRPSGGGLAGTAPRERGDRLRRTRQRLVACWAIARKFPTTVAMEPSRSRAYKRVERTRPSMAGSLGAKRVSKIWLTRTRPPPPQQGTIAQMAPELKSLTHEEINHVDRK